MAKREAKTDLWVYDLLKEAGICLDSQGCSIKEVDEALKTASKKGTGNVGYPEYAHYTDYQNEIEITHSDLEKIIDTIISVFDNYSYVLKNTIYCFD